MTRRLRIAFLALAALFGAAPRAGAQTGLLVPSSRNGPDPSVLSLREMAVDVGIARGYARVNVLQIFENHTDQIQEGTWRFALPPSGAVGDFAVWDGNVRIPGVILEKKRARAIYRELTQQRIDPGLLQQGEEEDREPGTGAPSAGNRPSGGAAFSVKVAPIPARGTKRLELQYQHELPWVDGVAELRVPLAPHDGEPTVAGELAVRVTLLDGRFEAPVAASLETVREGALARFEGRNVRMAKDLVIRFRPSRPEPLALTAFRNPSGSLPDGLALAPWERPSDVPPEKDGFFLLEQFEPARTVPGSPVAGAAAPKAESAGTRDRASVQLALVFDTSLSHRWSGLETAYAALVTILDGLGPKDRFSLFSFDRGAAAAPGGLVSATPEAKRAALEFLRSRPLQPGTAVDAAVKAAAKALAGAGAAGRIVLLTDGAAAPGNLRGATSGLPLFTILTGEERPESYAVASAALLVPAPRVPLGDDADSTLFLRRLLGPPERETAATGPARAHADVPFAIEGADPGLRDVYAVLTQPPAPGSLSGWVGRYAKPVAQATVRMKNGASSAAVSFPESALEARDLPRRWARARVDDLLRRIELEGERREWVEEILELSRRYKFVTPYTAFLAAPRSLLRPRRIQPGDPVIRIEADAGIVGATALLPFGVRVTLARRPKTNLWEGRFLVPEGQADGAMAVRLVLRDRSGRIVTETKTVVVDGTPPHIAPDLGGPARAGTAYRVAARADQDVVFLSARLGDGPPVPLRWDATSKRSVADLEIPAAAVGARELFFEATDGAGNHGFARAVLDVR